MQLVCDVVTKRGDKIGDRSIRSITPRAADKIYSIVINGPRGQRLRQGEKVISVCRHAWRVVHRLYPELFDKAVPNPWQGVTKKRRALKAKPAATREQVYRFAWGAIDAGCPEAAAAAVICFEWLQRPENVVGGYLTWPDYRPTDFPRALRIVHHKTGAVVWHPLEEVTPDGPVCFYPEAENVLGRLPRRGVPMILKAVKAGPAVPFSIMAMDKRVRKLRLALGLPTTFTLDACRHGGMTELETAELTDGQGRALSGHRTQRAYAGYAKRSLCTRPARNPQALRPQVGERGGNDYSECATARHSECCGHRRCSYCLSACPALPIGTVGPRGGVVTQRSAKPCTPVQFRSWPPPVGYAARNSGAPLHSRAD